MLPIAQMPNATPPDHDQFQCKKSYNGFFNWIHARCQGLAHQALTFFQNAQAAVMQKLSAIHQFIFPLRPKTPVGEVAVTVSRATGEHFLINAPAVQPESEPAFDPSIFDQIAGEETSCAVKLDSQATNDAQVDPVATPPKSHAEEEKENTSPDVLPLPYQSPIYHNETPASPCRKRSPTKTPSSPMRSPYSPMKLSPYTRSSEKASPGKRRPPQRPTAPAPYTVKWVVYQLKKIRPLAERLEDRGDASNRLAAIEAALSKDGSQQNIALLCEQTKQLLDYVKLFTFGFKPQFLDNPHYKTQIIAALEQKIADLPEDHPSLQTLKSNFKSIQDLFEKIKIIKNDDEEADVTEIVQEISRLFNECHIEYIKPIQEIKETEWVYNKLLEDLLTLNGILSEQKTKKALQEIHSDMLKSLQALLKYAEALKNQSDRMITAFEQADRQIYASHTRQEKSLAIHKYCSNITLCSDDVLRGYKNAYEDYTKKWSRDAKAEVKAGAFVAAFDGFLSQKKLVNSNTKQVVQSHNIDSLLLVPMQRIMRYPILLDAVLKHFVLAVGCKDQNEFDKISELGQDKERVLGKKKTIEDALARINKDKERKFDFNFGFKF